MQGKNENADRLVGWFAGKDSVLVAFSGGVDSSVIAKAAVLSGAKAIAATARSITFPAREMEQAVETAAEIGIMHVVFDEGECTELYRNPVDRCYFCRHNLTDGLKEIAKKHKMAVIVDGANADDTKEHRPGLRAMREAGVRSPLVELGFGKEDVRGMARNYGLSVQDKPSAACLASRIPYGEEITAGKLERIEKAEDFLLGLGFQQVRVRNHGSIARIEISENDIGKAAGMKKQILEKLKSLGFLYVTLDLQGYRSGSMDEAIPKKRRAPP